MDLSEYIGFPGLALLKTEAEQPTIEARFADLVARQSRFVYRVAYAVLRNPQDAEDVVQDTFFKLHRNGAWQQMDNECAFLATTAWRLAVDRIPRGRVAFSREPAVASHEQSVIDGDLEALVHRLMDALPEELRRPLALSAIDELTSREIAALLEIPEGTVRTRLMRARQVLKEKLAAYRENRHDGV